MKISIFYIVIGVVFLAIVMSFVLTIAPNVTFAGFSLSDSDTILTSCNYGGGQSSVSGGGTNPLVISASASGRQAERDLGVDVTGIDELIVLYEGFVSCNGLQSSGDIGIGVRGSTSGSVGFSRGVGCNSNSNSATLESSVVKLKNNYDGTWSSMKYLGYGDSFSVLDTQTVLGTPKLMLIASAGNACGLSGSGTSSLTIYNIGRKVNGSAQCQADEYVKGFDSSGHVICLTFPSIVLNSEEYAKESDLQKQQRLIDDLTVKNAYLDSQLTSLQQQLTQLSSQQQSSLQQSSQSLQQQIDSLNSQLKSTTTSQQQILLQQQIDSLKQQQSQSSNLIDRINLLESQLKDTKAILADVQANDKSVINTITTQEQFKRPNFIVEFINKIIAFFKNLFS